MNEKKKYREINRYWTDKTLTELGYSINLFTTLIIAFLGYLVSQDDLITNCCSWQTSVFFYTSLCAAVFGSLFGLASVLSRLTDFRITRSIANAKRIYFNEYNKGTQKTTEVITQSESFLSIILWLDNRLDKTLVKNKEEFHKRLVILRRRNRFLGRSTWRLHKLQIVLILLAIIFYAILKVTNFCC